MTSDADLTLCSATLLEDPTAPTSQSLYDELSVSREAGFAGISLWALHHEAALGGGRSPEEIIETVQGVGLAVPMVEAILPWDAPDAAAVREQAEAIFSLAEEFGATQAVVVTMADAPLDLAFAAERFRLVCEVGAAHGVGAMIEFLPWSGIPDLATAWRIVEVADQDNGGIMIDTWHWQRQPGGPALDLLATLPGERFPVVQLCDCAPGVAGGTMQEAMTDRRLPGEGDVDFAALFRVLDGIGAAPIIAPEVFNSALAAEGMPTMAGRIFDASRRVLDALEA